MKRKLSSLLTVAAVAVGLPVLAASPASAAPHGCYFQKVDNATFKTTCKYGGGHQRVIIRCKDGITGDTYQVEGPWKQYSQASCAAPWRQNASFVTVEVY